MKICHEHNLNEDLTEPRPFGVRVSLRSGDSFTRLLGRDWERTHWFTTITERDRALKEMASEHSYSRRGDRPTLRFEAIELGASE